MVAVPRKLGMLLSRASSRGVLLASKAAKAWQGGSGKQVPRNMMSRGGEVVVGLGGALAAVGWTAVHQLSRGAAQGLSWALSAISV